MRTVSYKCDKCGKPMTSRTAVKIAITLQRGADPSEKISHDFCQKCFVKVKKGFALLLTDAELPEVLAGNREAEPTPKTDVPVKEPVPKTEPVVKQEVSKPTEYWQLAEQMMKDIKLYRRTQNDSVRKEAADSLRRNLDKCALDENLKNLTAVYTDRKEENVIGYNMPAVAQFVGKFAGSYPKPATPEKKEHGGYHAEVVGPVTKEGSGCRFAVESMVPKAKCPSEPEAEQKDEPVSEDTAQKDEGVITGPLSKEEHALILKLHVEEGLDPEAIAKRMNRLTRGIKRCINTATKSGELDKLKSEFAARKADPTPQPEAVEDEEPESYAGSGVSNASIVRDSYTAPPQTEVVDGKRHDIGAILALAKAGWKPKDIASEKHYDEDVVRMLLEKYMR